jgi:hypothetical protein
MNLQAIDKIEELRAGIEKLSVLGHVSHYSCEDWWYSCPKSEKGCSNDEAGEDCNCGADEINAEVAAVKMELDGKIDELVFMVMQTPV